jgi:hypothetical protein
MSRRLGAIAAILGGGVSLGVATYVFVANFPGGIVVLGCLVAALVVAWYGLLRRARGGCWHRAGSAASIPGTASGARS